MSERLIQRHDQFFKRLIDKPGTQTRIWQALNRSEGRTIDGGRCILPPVIPLVVYHGEQPWGPPTRFAESFAVEPDLRTHLLDFCYILVDVGRIDDVELSREPALRTGLLILKWGCRDGDLRDTLLILGRAAAAFGYDEVVTMVRYLLGESNSIHRDLLRDVIHEILPDQEERIMSIAAEEFRAEGKAEGKAEVLLRLLHRRFGPLSDAIMAQIRTADCQQLDIWLDNILDARSVNGVFGQDERH
jgi:hypothetical protein